MKWQFICGMLLKQLFQQPCANVNMFLSQIISKLKFQRWFGTGQNFKCTKVEIFWNIAKITWKIAEKWPQNPTFCSWLSKCSYFDVILLNKKMVITEIALKSGFALILHALKSRFHCTMLMAVQAMRLVPLLYLLHLVWLIRNNAFWKLV